MTSSEPATGEIPAQPITYPPSRRRVLLLGAASSAAVLLWITTGALAVTRLVEGRAGQLSGVASVAASTATLTAVFLALANWMRRCSAAEHAMLIREISSLHRAVGSGPYWAAYANATEDLLGTTATQPVTWLNGRRR